MKKHKLCRQFVYTIPVLQTNGDLNLTETVVHRHALIIMWRQSDATMEVSPYSFVMLYLLVVIIIHVLYYHDRNTNTQSNELNLYVDDDINTIFQTSHYIYKQK